MSLNTPTPSDPSSEIDEGTERPIVDTIILSDIHLGSDVARSREALALLRSYRFRRLILNGDVFDDLNFTRLSKDDWKLLSYFRRMSNPRRGIDVVWVVGNHDGGVAEILTHLLGVPVHEEYVFHVGDRRILAIHGHQFDRWITDHVVVTAIASTVYLWLQRIDPGHRVSRWVKRSSKRWLRLSDKVGTEAAHHGFHRHSADVVICGHTHLATTKRVGEVLYVNSGCWTDRPSQYVTISAEGELTLHEF